MISRKKFDFRKQIKKNKLTEKNAEGRTVNRKEFIRKVAEKSGVTQKITGEVISSVLEVITEALSQGEKVEIRGFGSFFMKKREKRVARNPRTNKPLKLPSKLVPYFKAGKELKEATVKVLEPPKKKRGRRKTKKK
jgi:nucleoid DNA-binding protein